MMAVSPFGTTAGGLSGTVGKGLVSGEVEGASVVTLVVRNSVVWGSV